MKSDKILKVILYLTAFCSILFGVSIMIKQLTLMEYLAIISIVLSIVSIVLLMIPES